jgi:transcription initiation factor TFIID TATA-box-binding protein
MEQLYIRNVVSTFNCDVSLNLKHIVLHAGNVEYRPKKFPAIVMRIKSHFRATALMFSSGKVVIVGCASVEQSKLAARKFAKILQKLHYNIDLQKVARNFKIQNVVGSFSFGKQLRLAILSQLQCNFCSYEPELFPGLHYRFQESSIVVLIFQSGKIVITGAKTVEKVHETHQTICNVLNMMGECIILK